MPRQTKDLTELEEKNKGYIVFIRCGIFYTGIGKDAVILTENVEGKMRSDKVEVESVMNL